MYFKIYLFYFKYTYIYIFIKNIFKNSYELNFPIVYLNNKYKLLKGHSAQYIEL